MDLSTVVTQAFEAYRTFQLAHPIIGSMLAAEVVFPLGDISSQIILDGKIDWKKIRYTAGLAPAYGLFAYVNMKSGDVVGEYIMEHPLAKAAFGPNLWGNLFNTIFFVNNTVGEKNKYSLKKLVEHYKDLLQHVCSWNHFQEHYVKNIPLREYLYATAATLTVWNAFQWWNYASVPTELQTPAALAAGLVWLVTLSVWSLNGRRKIVTSIEPDSCQDN